MLTADFPGAEDLRLQLPFVEVVGRCACGCATISVEVDRARAPAAAVIERMPVEAYGASRRDGLLLFVDDGYLSGVEIYTTEDELPSVFPPPSSFSAPRPVSP